MNLNNGEIFRAREPLMKLLEHKFPVKTAYGLAKLSNKLNEQLKIIEEVRMGLIRKYGEKNEKGSISVKQEGENWEKFVDEFNELMAQEVEIVIDKVRLPEKIAATCDKCNHNMDRTLEIEPNLLIALEKFIEV